MQIVFHQYFLPKTPKCWLTTIITWWKSSFFFWDLGSSKYALALLSPLILLVLNVIRCKNIVGNWCISYFLLLAFTTKKTENCVNFFWRSYFIDMFSSHTPIFVTWAVNFCFEIVAYWKKCGNRRVLIIYFIIIN